MMAGLSFVLAAIFVLGIQLLCRSRHAAGQAIGGMIIDDPNSHSLVADNSQQVAPADTQTEDSPPTTMTDAHELEIETKLKHQQERLQNIEERATQKRQQVQSDYLQRCRELQTRTESMIRSLDSQEKQDWAELNQKLRHIVTTAEKSTIGVGRITPNGYIDGYDVSKERYETTVVGNPVQEHASRQQEIVKTKNETLTSYEQELAHLEKRRQYELAQVDKWETQMKGYVSVAVRQITTEPQSGSLGLVTGIMYSQNRPSALIGNRIIVHQGDVVHGIRILEIHRDKVLFEKDSVTWAQAIGEAPALHWK